MSRRKIWMAAGAALMTLTLCGCENVIVDSVVSLLNAEPKAQAVVELHSVENAETETALGAIAYEGEEEVSREALVNLSGYESTGEKIAIFRGEELDETFEVVDTKTEETIFSGYIVEVKQNKKNGEINARGDFSSLKNPGTYYIRTKNQGSSASFMIEKEHYSRLLEERKQYFSDRKTEISDGIQLNRSIMQTTDWLLTYEFFTAATADSGTPELLTLAKKEIERLSACQNEKTGSVTAGDPITQAQTYRYAAVFSMFADSYEDFGADYAAKCRECAILAWEYAGKQDKQENMRDEHYWAAAQLYKLTGETSYLSIVKSETSGEIPTGFSEEETGYLGSLAYLTTSYQTELKLSNRMMKALFDDAIAIVNESEQDGYLAAVGDTYNEGSVQLAFSNARLLTLANIVSKSVDYVNAAGWHLEYLYGRNPLMINYAGDTGSIYYEEPEAFILSGLIYSYILNSES